MEKKKSEAYVAEAAGKLRNHQQQHSTRINLILPEAQASEDPYAFMRRESLTENGNRYSINAIDVCELSNFNVGLFSGDWIVLRI